MKRILISVIDGMVNIDGSEISYSNIKEVINKKYDNTKDDMISLQLNFEDKDRKRILDLCNDISDLSTELFKILKQRSKQE